MTSEVVPAIEHIKGGKARHRGETSGGEITIYRLKLMTAEEITRHGLEKYAPVEGEDNAGY